MRLIGVDTGGTFTDAVAVDDGGCVSIGKALSTPDRVDDGVLAAIGAIADGAGTTVRDLLTGTDVLAHGTTVGLNALLTRTGARVGLLTTEGFESTLAIAKANKLYELTDTDLHSPSRWRKPVAPVRRSDVLGIQERIDVTGSIVTPLDETGTRSAIRRLLDAGVDSLAVSLLWSPVNPLHERRVRELAAELSPGTHVSISSEVAPRIGEYERTCTTVIDAYTAPLVTRYLRRLEERLREHGFRGEFVVMRMAGGVQPVAAALRTPVQTLRSGPAGGVSACQRLGRLSGRAELIATDVGGTSFDVGLVIGGEPYSAGTPSIDRLPLAVPAVDIPSIGTGGGSIAWYDRSLRTLRVGPQSAGADPGPACYGRGGVLPTLTDAAVVLGYLQRLGGTLDLDRAAAQRAITEHLAGPLGLGVLETAEGILSVAAAQMRDLVRRTTIQRGHDPSDFALVAYGGAGPQYVGRYAADLGVREVVIPGLAAEFSAFGAMSSDLRVSGERDLQPCRLQDAGELVQAALDRIAPEVKAQLGSGELVVRRLVGLRFYRQLNRIDLPVPDGPVDKAVLTDLAERFLRRYEDLVGPGSAPPDSPIEVVAVVVEAIRPVAVPERTARPTAGAEPIRRQPAWFDGRHRDCPVFRWDDIAAAQRLCGPCLVESDQTTVVVYPGQALRMLPDGNAILELTT